MDAKTKQDVQQGPSHEQIVQDVIDKVKSKDNSFYFYCPPLNTPSGGIAVLLKMARLLKDAGYNPVLAYEPRPNQRASYEVSQKQKKQVTVFDKFNPAWINFDISDIEIYPMGEGKEKMFSDDTTVKCEMLNLKPEDFLFIPEGFPDIMKKTMQVACKKIVVAQSWFYILNSMSPGEKWQNFGITDVISVSNAITEYLAAIMPGLKIKQFSQSVDRSIFKVPEKKSEKYPMVAFSCSRGPENRMKTLNIVRTFQAFYPHLNWVRFIELAGLTREEYAERLGSCAFALYTDDIAGFGTMPLEAMASGTHVVGWNAFGGKEYVNDQNGFWTVNGDLFQTAEILGIAIDKWLNGELDVPEVQEEYEKTLDNYTPEKENEQILTLIKEYENERLIELEKIKQKQ